MVNPGLIRLADVIGSAAAPPNIHKKGAGSSGMSPRQRRASPHPASDRHSKRAGMLPPPPRPVSTSPARDIKRLAPRLDHGCAPAPDIAKGRDRRQPRPLYPFAGETPGDRKSTSPN